MILGVYQDWMHQNTGEHLDGGIPEDGKWQARWEKIVYIPTQLYDLLSGKFGRMFFGILFLELDGV